MNRSTLFVGGPSSRAAMSRQPVAVSSTAAVRPRPRHHLPNAITPSSSSPHHLRHANLHQLTSSIHSRSMAFRSTTEGQSAASGGEVPTSAFDIVFGKPSAPKELYESIARDARESSSYAGSVRGISAILEIGCRERTTLIDCMLCTVQQAGMGINMHVGSAACTLPACA